MVILIIFHGGINKNNTKNFKQVLVSFINKQQASLKNFLCIRPERIYNYWPRQNILFMLSNLHITITISFFLITITITIPPYASSKKQLGSLKFIIKKGDENISILAYKSK